MTRNCVFRFEIRVRERLLRDISLGRSVKYDAAISLFPIDLLLSYSISLVEVTDDVRLPLSCR